MAGAVQAGALVVDVSVETAKVKAGMAENVRTVDGTAKKMAADLMAIRQGFESALDPLKSLTVKVGSLESNLAKAQSASFSLGKNLILGAAAGMSIDAIRGKVMGVIDTMATLKTLSEKTGSSVENLSKLGFFAKQAGSDIDTLIGGMNKMAKGMAGADDETKGAGAALSYLGLKAKDAAGNMKDPYIMMSEIAKKLGEYKDGAGKVALAQALWGKSGADMLPTLKLMGEQGDITAKTFDAQATAARQYQRDLVKLDAQKGVLFKTIAVSLLPTLTDFTNAMIDATKETNLTNGAVKKLAEEDLIADWADTGALAVSALIDVIKLIPLSLKAAGGSFKAVGADLDVAAKKALSLNPFHVASELAQGRSPQYDLNKAIKEREETLKQANENWSTLWNKPGDQMYQAMQNRIAARKAGGQTKPGKPGGTKELDYDPADAAKTEAERAAAATAALKYAKADLDARLNLERAANAQQAALRKEGVAGIAELNRQGMASDTQLYIAKYDAAIQSGIEIAAVKSKEISILAAYNGKDQAEKRAANGKMAVLEIERTEALRSSVAEAALLRQQYIFDSDKPAREAQAAADLEIEGTYKQIDVLKEQYAAYGLLPEAITAINIAKLAARGIALEENGGSEAEIIINQRKLVSLRALADQQKKNSDQSRGGDVAQAKELLDIMTSLDEAAQSAASGMASAFGAVGSAVGGLTTALTGYERAQAAIAAQLASAKKDAFGDPEKIAKAQVAAAKQGAQAQMKSYGDMAGAAKGFFKESTAGYRAMEGAEKAYRAVEMAMAIESMVRKLFTVNAVTTATIGAEAAKSVAIQAGTATQVASDTVKGTSAAAVAVATQAQGDPYSAWPRMAAMAAVMAALGFAVSGGGGADTTAKDRQAATGTGSVFGDSSAKSESIAHSLAIMEKNSGLGLLHTNSMASSLKQLVGDIGGLTTLLVRNAGLSGAMAPNTKGTAAKIGSSGLGVGVAGDILLGLIPGVGLLGGAIGLVLDKITGGLIGRVTGGIMGSIFGGKTTSLDTGIIMGKTTLGNAIEHGVSANQYTDTKTDGGWFSSDKYRTKLDKLGDEASDQFSAIIAGLSQTVRSGAEALGLGGDAFNEKMNSFVVDLGKISIKDLKGDEIQKALESAFGKLGDDMARFGVDGLKSYQRVGEGYLETLARVANDYLQVSDVLTVLSKSFGVTGLEAVKLSEGLIAAAGGLDKLTNGTSYFVQNFLSEAEQMAPITKSVRVAMDALGYSSITTNEQFKSLVMGLDLSTAAGQSMYGQLIALAEPFKKAADYAAELAAATGNYAAAAKTASEIANERRDLQSQLDKLTLTSAQLRAQERLSIAEGNRALFDQVAARQDIAAAYDTESEALKTSIERLKTFAAGLATWRDGMQLGNLSTLTPVQKMVEAQRQYEETLAKAKAGDQAAQSALAAAATAYLTADQAAKGSSDAYAADVMRVQSEMAALAAAVGTQLSDAEKQQATMDKTVGELITLNQTATSMKDAILALGAALRASGQVDITASMIDGSHATGLAHVPFDGYLANTHAGEAIIDAQSMNSFRRYFGGAPSQGGGNTDALVAEIKALRTEVAGLRADQRQQTSDVIEVTAAAHEQSARTIVAGTEDALERTTYNQQQKSGAIPV